MTYYFSPLNVNNLGIVDHAHEWPDGVRHCHHAHIYHEGEGKKGADNIASLLMKTLKENNIARLEERGGLSLLQFLTTAQAKTKIIQC